MKTCPRCGSVETIYTVIARIWCSILLLRWVPRTNWCLRCFKSEDFRLMQMGEDHDI